MRQLVRQFVYTMFVTNSHAFFSFAVKRKFSQTSKSLKILWRWLLFKSLKITLDEINFLETKSIAKKWAPSHISGHLWMAVSEIWNFCVKPIKLVLYSFLFVNDCRRQHHFILFYSSASITHELWNMRGICQY